MNPEYYMGEALKQAKKAFDKGEVPVGSVLVYQGNIIARSHNLVETSLDATMHAEMQCLREGARVFQNWRLLNCTLYTTLEPCAMCGGALILSRVEKVVYGAQDLRHGSCGGWSNFLNEKHPIHTVLIEGGVLAEESKELLKTFFKQQREKKRI